MNKVAENPPLPIPTGNTMEWFSYTHHLVAAIQRLLTASADRLNRVFPSDGSERMTATLPLCQYTVATRPVASTVPWGVIAVTDGAAGAQFQASNGTAWVNLG